MGVESYWVKVEKAKRILLMNGYSFVVVAMKYELSHPLVQNADLLTGFSKNSRIELSATQIETLESALLDHPLELGTVCTRLGLGLRESPVLLLSGLVAADLTESRLCAKTLVRLAHGDLSHLSLLSLAGEQT